MSLSIAHICAALGVNVPIVTIEVHISNGLPGLTMVGLPKTTVREARDQVHNTVISGGYESPVEETTMNFAPADLPKKGGRYDLPIIAALPAVPKQLATYNLDTYELVDELALTDALHGVPGAVSNTAEAICVGRRVIVAKKNTAEVGLIYGEECPVADRLQAVCASLEDKYDSDRPSSADFVPCALADDLSDVIGQEQDKCELELTTAGGHNFLLIGPLGTGRTMLVNHLGGSLPPLSNDEALEGAMILNLINPDTLQKQWKQRPFRSSYHSASLIAMVGGGSVPMPGEISLAHNGVLFLDELPELERRILDVLREPIEFRRIHLSRIRAEITYPACFQLIAAINPSPTGHYQRNHNRYTPKQTLCYLGRLSGPLLSHLDLSLEIPISPPGILSRSQVRGEDSAMMKRRVMAARERQYRRQNKSNAHLDSQDIHKYYPLHNDGAQWLEKVLAHLRLSIHAWLRLIKVARTIADIERSDYISR